ncbi:unnamed protein product [Plutella xylostella]|uniref:(diamondback moth) hypothetical protein n=1 Tax=Plutella xylostella TaxID=51655 RepID=A0A8S4FRE8_PLUXY|nr:unnamed protein product [Plutella xylostella]
MSEEVKTLTSSLSPAPPSYYVEYIYRGNGSMKKDLQNIIWVFQGTDPYNILMYVARDLYKLPPVTLDHINLTRLAPQAFFI